MRRFVVALATGLMFSVVGCGGSDDSDDPVTVIINNPPPDEPGMDAGTPVPGPTCQEGETFSCGDAPGICTNGFRWCEAGGIADVCVEYVDPAPEQCDNGQDEDCDGLIDEDDGLTGERCCDPRAEELPNNRDDNCNGTVDEGFECPVEGQRRECGTDVGTCRTGTQRCRDGVWSLCEGARGPDATDRCNDDLDNDCDGDTDETCPCTAGEIQSCGPSADRIAGVCRSGIRTCTGTGWGACTGAVHPSAEECGDGLDNDCNGMTDETCPCADREVQECGPDQTNGICRRGLMTCLGNRWGGCDGDVFPEAEVFDHEDNDCNGIVDDNFDCRPGTTQRCGTDVGACVRGTSTCTRDGQWGDCLGGVGPDTEDCDRLRVDEDCDGSANEGCTCSSPGTFFTCETMRPGDCSAGLQLCGSDGLLRSCLPNNAGALELCNGEDDDCDGAADETCICTPGAERPCGNTLGLCTLGMETCNDDGFWQGCTGTMPEAEVCNTARADEDCDGSIDEDCACSPGARQPCGRNEGRCTIGEQVCNPDAIWGRCSGVQPEAERCNGIDDDCDATVDEGCECVDFSIRPCGSDVGVCEPGLQECIFGFWFGCGLGYVGPDTEVCGDGLDNDCDTTADETCPCTAGDTRSCGPDTTNGICRRGTETCQPTGTWGACIGATFGTPEICGNLTDDDCNAEVDDGCGDCIPGTIVSCGSDVGLCEPGTQTCDSTGSWGDCLGETNPQTEVCGDGLDNDCDTTADETCPCTAGDTRSCGPDTTNGICRRGTETCQPTGTWGACIGATFGTPEICGNLTDDDCNAEVDDGCGDCIPGTIVSCGSDVGLCEPGTQTCDSTGSWGDCLGETNPQTEVCGDGLDNDCDTTADETCPCTAGDTRSCGPDTTNGICRRGTETCQPTGTWGACIGATFGTPEICGNLTDDDCNAEVDDGCGDCIPGTIVSCGSSVGFCREGTQTCNVIGQWDECLGERGPRPEICFNGIDDNCNTTVDGLVECFLGL